MNKRRKRQSENVRFEREKSRLAADTIKVVDGTRRGMSSRLITVRRTPSNGRDEPNREGKIG